MRGRALPDRSVPSMKWCSKSFEIQLCQSVLDQVKNLPPLHADPVQYHVNCWLVKSAKETKFMVKLCTLRRVWKHFRPWKLEIYSCSPRLTHLFCQNVLEQDSEIPTVHWHLPVPPEGALWEQFEKVIYPSSSLWASMKVKKKKKKESGRVHI